jgi:hypothetical protein
LQKLPAGRLDLVPHGSSGRGIAGLEDEQSLVARRATAVGHQVQYLVIQRSASRA